MTDGAGGTPVAAIRERAAEMVRALAADLRAAQRSHAEADDDTRRAVLAAVEALESLADTAEAMLPALPEASRGVVQLAVRGAWERLEAAGIRRDGAVGEAVDLTRHRVVKTRGSAAVVSAVIAPGIVFGARRIREAAVAASGGEEHGPRRD